VLLVVAASVGVATAALPSLATQLVLVLGAAVTAASVVAARLGWILNASWVVVAALYLAGPIRAMLLQAGIGVSLVGALVVTFLPFVVVALVQHREARSRLILLAPLVLLLAFAVFSLAWSPDASYGADKLVLWTLTGLLPATFILVLAPATARISWRPIAVAAALTAFALILFGEPSPLFAGRVILFDANPIWEARALFIGAIVVTFTSLRLPLKVALVLVIVYAGVLTVSRGPALAFLLGVGVGGAEILRGLDRHDRRIQLAWAAIGLTTAFGLLLLLGLLDTAYTGFSGILVDPDVSSRVTYLGEAGRLFSGAPLAGIGIGGFASTGLDLYPHNLVAEVAAELGVLGLLTLGSWLAIAVRGALGSPILMALVVATAVFSLFSGSLASNAEFWLCSSLAVARVPLGAARQTQVFHQPATARG
jgi:O-antigen ligase